MNTKNIKTTSHMNGHPSRDLVDDLLADFSDEYVAPLELPRTSPTMKLGLSDLDGEIGLDAQRPKERVARGVVRQAELEGLAALERLHSRRDGPIAGIRRVFPNARSLLGIGLIGGTALAALLLAGAAMTLRR
jgi:hypothetical protein